MAPILAAQLVTAQPAGFAGSTSEFSATFWTVENGLPGNAVAAIAKSGEGYLWVATLNGPARFDGARFVRMRSADGIKSLLTHRLLSDSRGRLWIGTQDAGLMMLDGGRVSAFSGDDGLPGFNVRGLAEDSKGGIWVATDEGLVRWDGKFSNTSPQLATSPRPGFSSVFCAGEKVYGVSDDRRIWVWSKNTWSMLPPLGKTGSRFDQVFVTREGVVWSQLYPRGLVRLEEAAVDSSNATNDIKGTWRLFGVESGLPDSFISALLEQPNGDLLCGTFERGLFLFSGDRGSPAGLNEGPNKDGILAMAEDEGGNLWVGTRSLGLVRLRHARVRTLSTARVARLQRPAYDGKGRLWIGGGEGLWFGEEGALAPVPLPERLQRFSVSALVPAVQGGTWIATLNGGLWRFDPDTHSKPVQEYRTPQTDQSLLSLASDGAGGVWFGTANGRVGHAARGKSELFDVAETATQKRISVLARDPRGGVWAGMNGGGVARVDNEGNVQLRLDSAQGLPGNGVRCLMVDREGTLWIGTPGGLCRWKSGRLSVFDIRQGLPEELMCNIAEDDAGRLWCAAGNRLYRLDKGELDLVANGSAKFVHPLSVVASDGMNPGPFASGTPSEVMRAPDGRLLFPRIWEVLTLDPKDFEGSPPLPRPRIEEVHVDGQSVGFRAAEPHTVRIPPRRTHIEIRYTALQWTAPESLRFRYRVRGLDESWTEAGEDRVASFRHLPAGEYQFEMTASAAAQQWADSAARLAFVVEPFFWQTAWFRFLVVLIGAGSLAAVAWASIRRVEKRRLAQELFSRRLMESQEAERRRIAAELHDGLGQNLVLVKNLAILKQPGASEKSPIDQIAAAAERALQEVHAISYALRPPELDRLGLAKAIAGMVRRASEASTIRFDAKLDLNGALPAGADIQLFRIAQEAVSNLVKHSGAKTARVELWQDEAGVHLVVADDGRGLQDTDSQGLGLAGIEERTRLLSGELNVVSAPGRGTTLSVLVPLNCDS